MTSHNPTPNQTLHSTSVGKRMLVGAVIGLTLISIFLILAGEGNPAWPAFWRIRPLVIVSIAGAMAGLFDYIMDYLRAEGEWRKILANILSFVVYLLAIWLGSVLGLAGTLWN